MHATFLDPFLWYQLLKLAVDHFFSPCLPNCILFFDNSEHPHQSLLLLRSHWLMALPVKQNKSQQQENLSTLQERNRKKKEIRGSRTMEQHTKTPPIYPQFSNNSEQVQADVCFLHPAALQLSGSTIPSYLDGIPIIY